MTMRPTPRTLIWIAAGIFAVAAAGACDHTPSDTAAGSAPPAIRTPVGPVPGPAQNPPREQNPFHDDLGAIAEGRTLFVRMNCSGCHGGHAGGGMGPSLRDVDWMYGHTDAQIFSSIAEGRAHGMPAWGTKLPTDQIWKLVAYIKSMRTPYEAQPPS
jgi:cytochrome c oxidase cbb3-type subunit 3